MGAKRGRINSIQTAVDIENKPAFGLENKGILRYDFGKNAGLLH